MLNQAMEAKHNTEQRQLEGSQEDHSISQITKENSLNFADGG